MLHRSGRPHPESGSVALIFALAAPLVIGGATVATDAASIVREQATIQTIADSTALASARELQIALTDEADVAAAATARARTLLAEAGVEAEPSIAVDVDEKAGRVLVELAVHSDTIMLQHFGYGEIVSATAEARLYGTTRLCILALAESGSGKKAIRLDRIGTIRAEECAMQSNGTVSDAIDVGALSRVHASAICSAGGVSGGAAAFNPEPQTDCPIVEDPLAAREVPEAGPCDYKNKTILLGLHRISPGHYCGGLKLGAAALVKADPGDYIISGGDLSLGLAAALTGENVSFRFVGPKAGFRFAETAIVSLGAPKEGPMAGFLFYRDPDPQPGDFVIGTDLATKLLGTIYLPGATLTVDVIGLVAAQSAYTVIVADRIDIRGAELVVNSDYGATDIPVPRGVGPTGGKVALSK